MKILISMIFVFACRYCLSTTQSRSLISSDLRPLHVGFIKAAHHQLDGRRAHVRRLSISRARGGGRADTDKKFEMSGNDLVHKPEGANGEAGRRIAIEQNTEARAAPA
jgi:hypothetical protein